MEETTMINCQEMVNRYFDGDTSEEEERLLRRFLATEAGRSSEFDEVRAVMSVFAAGKAVNQTRHKSRKLWPWLAAACVAGLAWLLWTGIGGTQDVCVAYVNGQKITDRNEVLALMQESWDDIEMQETGNTVEEQLTDLFNTLE